MEVLRKKEMIQKKRILQWKNIGRQIRIENVKHKHLHKKTISNNKYQVNL